MPSGKGLSFTVSVHSQPLPTLSPLGSPCRLLEPVHPPLPLVLHYPLVLTWEAAWEPGKGVGFSVKHLGVSLPLLLSTCVALSKLPGSHGP